MSNQVINSAFMLRRGNLGDPAHYDSSYYPYLKNATVVDTVPKEILHLIHEHWYQFPPLNPLWHSLLGVAMIVLGIISVLGNGMVIYLMSSTKVYEIYS